MSAPDSILVVIVNYRSAQLVIDCLRSLRAEKSEVEYPVHALVVDNASGDDSIEQLGSAIQANGWSGWVELQLDHANGGFAAGNNAAIRVALAGPYSAFLLLNPDTIVLAGGIGKLMKFLRADPRRGIVGPRLEGPAGEIQASAHHFPSLLTEFTSAAQAGFLMRCWPRLAISPPVRHEAHRCDWVSGAAMLVRRQVFEDIGLLDEQFFLYYEEVDFCKRAKAAGWEIWQEPAARIVHLEGGSVGAENGQRRHSEAWFASRHHFFRKHYGRCGPFLADCFKAAGRSVRPLREWVRS